MRFRSTTLIVSFQKCNDVIGTAIQLNSKRSCIHKGVIQVEVQLILYTYLADYASPSLANTHYIHRHMTPDSIAASSALCTHST